MATFSPLVRVIPYYPTTALTFSPSNFVDGGYALPLYATSAAEYVRDEVPGAIISPDKCQQLGIPFGSKWGSAPQNPYAQRSTFTPYDQPNFTPHAQPAFPASVLNGSHPASYSTPSILPSGTGEL